MIANLRGGASRDDGGLEVFAQHVELVEVLPDDEHVFIFVPFHQHLADAQFRGIGGSNTEFVALVSNGG